MAIISCGECSHQVSDRAASCPSCGAPVTPAVETKPRGRRVIPRVLITLMALWTLGTLVWLVVPGKASDQLMALAKTSFERFHQRTGQLWTTRQVQASSQNQAVHQSAAAAQVQVIDRPASTPRPVYQTTAEQLYRDYSANVVAIQTKIGASLVRLSGNIAEIDLDVTGRPVVKLWTSNDNSAAMTLTEDQRGAAAQLAKGETVEIECDKIAHLGASLAGNDCTLAFVDARPREVNLGLVLANNNETAKARTSARKKTPASSHGNAATRAVTTVPTQVSPAAPTFLLPVEDSAVIDSTLAAPRRSEHRATNIHMASAGNSDIGTATAAARAPVEEATVAHAPQGYIGGSTTLTLQGESRDTTSPGRGATGVDDDLAQVRTVDPQAADHIATYCSKSIVSPNNQDSLVTECRRREAEAWTRLILKNEFPTLDEATRKKCNEPPFPDTYLAKERCAQYQLHMN